MASVDHGCIYPVVGRLEIMYKNINLSPYIPSLICISGRRNGEFFAFLTKLSL